MKMKALDHQVLRLRKLIEKLYDKTKCISKRYEDTDHLLGKEKLKKEIVKKWLKEID